MAQGPYYGSMNRYLKAGGHILVPTDFTEHARRAFEAAIRLARMLDAKLTILHVNEEEAFFAWHHSGRIGHLLTEIAPKRSRWMEELEAEARDCGIEAESMSRDGVASGTILAVADELDASIIVMGTKGVRGMRHILTGSTARNVLRGSHRPVLTVSATAQVDPPEDGGVFKHVLYPTDFSEASQDGLGILEGLLSREAQHLTLLHVLRLPTMLPSLPGEPLVVLPSGTDADLEGILHAQLEAAASRVEAREVDTQVELHASIVESIIEVAERESVDLIVIPRHSQHTWRSFFFGHTAETLTKMSPVPVLIFEPTVGSEEEI